VFLWGVKIQSLANFFNKDMAGMHASMMVIKCPAMVPPRLYLLALISA
jgi:hypothetical protein